MYQEFVEHFLNAGTEDRKIMLDSEGKQIIYPSFPFQILETVEKKKKKIEMLMTKCGLTEN